MRIDFSKASGWRVHGNGFIQVDIDRGVRLHIWGHPDIPRQKVDTSIHDHRFDFRSLVLRGRLVNAHYPLGYTYTYDVYFPHTREGEDTILVDAHQKIALASPMVKIIREGEGYGMSALEFHETLTDRPSATVMTKLGRTHEVRPRVLVPVGKTPDNDFARTDFPVTEVRKIIKDVLGYI